MYTPVTTAPDQPQTSPAPPKKRAVAFIDGQNLFHAAQEAFGCDYPNYHPLTLTDRICGQRGWECLQVRFYTGVPKREDNPYCGITSGPRRNGF